MSDEDMGLDILLAVRSEVSPRLDENLLRQCYLVQKRFQFNDDRSISSATMEKLIDEYVKNQAVEAQS